MADTKKRPFFRFSIYQLETIVENRQPHEDMSDITFELSFRRTSKAKSLLKKLSTTKISSKLGEKISINNNSKNNACHNRERNYNYISLIFIAVIIILLIY